MTLHNEVPQDAGDYVQADAQRLKQVLLNLVSNAIKYNKPKAARSGSRSRRRLPDRTLDPGHATPARGSPRRTRRSSSRRSTGWGRRDHDRGDRPRAWRSSKLLTEAMGGTLAVESEPSGRQHVHDRPRRRRRARAADGETAEQPLRRRRRTAPAADTETVLYVEDNQSNLRLVQRILAKRPQVKLLSAMDGPLGLELARQHEPALILLDLHLPAWTARRC